MTFNLGESTADISRATAWTILLLMASRPDQRDQRLTLLKDTDVGGTKLSKSRRSS